MGIDCAMGKGWNGFMLHLSATSVDINRWCHISSASMAIAVN